MTLRNTEESWGWPARLMHWAGALLVIGMLGLGFYMVNFVDSMIDRLNLTQIHKSFGFVVFMLALTRVIWRLANPTPAAPSHMGPAERALAHGVHIALYVLMIAMPLTGWLMASSSPLNDVDAYPFQIKNMVFGLFELPDPFQPGDKALSKALAQVHFYTGLALSVIVAGHILAAIKHQSIDRDGLIRRMIRG